LRAAQTIEIKVSSFNNDSPQVTEHKKNKPEEEIKVKKKKELGSSCDFLGVRSV